MICASPAAAKSLDAGEKATARTGLTRPEPRSASADTGDICV